jgi:predicted DNA-binding transcriptional regulator AlpA
MISLVSIKDLQESFGLKRTAMYNLRKSDGFPLSVTPSCSHPRFRRSEVEAWMTQNQQVH